MDLLICISSAADPDVAVEEAESMWDLEAMNVVVLHQDGDSGRYEVAHETHTAADESWNVTVSEV